MIIYLASGAPFAVYYFLQNRNLPDKKIVYLKTFIRFVFWIPFAIRLVARKRFFTKFYNLDFDRNSNSESAREEKISAIQKKLENELARNPQKFSIFEFREIFERYVGLTVEMQSDAGEIGTPEREIFRISRHENKKLGEICLHRRNRRRLIFHQNLARLDFFDLLSELTNRAPDKQTVCDEASKLFSLLQDTEAIQMFGELSNETLQTGQTENVSKLEKDLWKADQPKPSPANRTSTNLQPLRATANLSSKD